MGSTIVHQGIKIGHLEILEELENNKYRCKCDCGTECIRSVSSLRAAVRNNKDLYCSYGCTLKYSKYIGLRSGHLEVIQVLDKVVDGKYLCKCRCDCGNIVEKFLTLIIHKRVQSCGNGCACNIKYKDMSDFIGKRFGKLVVLEYSHKTVKDGYTNHYYVCKCDCGNVAVVQRQDLQSGGTKSCGCLKTELFTKEVGTGLHCIKADNKLKSNNTSGKAGVSYSKKLNKWRAYIKLKRKWYHLGVYDTKEEAEKARDRGMDEYWKPINEAHGESLYRNPENSEG